MRLLILRSEQRRSCRVSAKSRQELPKYQSIWSIPWNHTFIMCVIFISINSYSIDDFSSHEYRNFEKIQRNRFPLLLSKTVLFWNKKISKSRNRTRLCLRAGLFQRSVNKECRSPTFLILKKRSPVPFFDKSLFNERLSRLHGQTYLFLGSDLLFHLFAAQLTASCIDIRPMFFTNHTVDTIFLQDVIKC